jgi:hypothetical protein
MKPDLAKSAGLKPGTYKVHLRNPPTPTNCAGHLCWREDGHDASCPYNFVVEFLGWRLVSPISPPCFL